MTKHIHAELMALYAQDAMETNRPQDRWQVMGKSGWSDLECYPCWAESLQYRRKPKTSRERFEEWKFNHCFRLEKHLDATAWMAWQEAERQATEGSQP